ncbi:MAG: hypothetical protein COA93_07880 [Alphaproteobacteria bacterium]|nr:MAG: hypothetical protein COA93_07880 [Alphaproteobacteria bacterium]
MKYPKLNPLLANQLSAIPPSLYDKVNYYPSSVELNSGEILENVLLVVAGEYYSSWGVWPHEDSSKEDINLGNIKYVFPSRNRIPLQFSQKIISYEESGMGYSLFYFVFKDGNKVLSLCGGICDFFVLPDSYLVEDIINVQPFARDNNQPIVPIIKTANFYFCLYDE